MNTTVTNALNATNEARQAGVVQQAQCSINYILAEKANIASYTKAKNEAQVRLNAIADDVISHETIVGTPAPTTPNANQVTILKAIAEANKARQTQVEAKAKIEIANISSYDKSIAGCEKRIAELRADMLKLEADVVTAESIS